MCHATCDAFALDDAGVSGYEGSNNRACATFFGAGCANFQDLFLELDSYGSPPLTPPSPAPPLVSLSYLPPRRIFFDGGHIDSGGTGVDTRRRSLAVDSSEDQDVIQKCTDGASNTLCATFGSHDAVRTSRAFIPIRSIFVLTSLFVVLAVDGLGPWKPRGRSVHRNCRLPISRVATVSAVASFASRSAAFA